MNDLLDRSIDGALAELVARAPALGSTPSDDLLPPHAARRDRPRSLVAAAAAGVLVVGAAAVLYTTTRATDQGHGPTPADEPTTTVVATGQFRTLVPPDLAALGLQPTRTGLGGSQRTEPSSYQRRVYGSAATPEDPTRMVLVELSRDVNDGDVTCRHVAGAEPFEVAGGTGWTCQQGQTPSADWIVDGTVVEMLTGSAVTRDELISLATSFRADPTNPDAAPPLQLEPSPLPAGWVTLVGEDVPYAQQVTEAAWVATASGRDGDATQLWVKTWTGVDDDREALYDINPPISSEAITVRGHPGYLFVSPQQGAHGPLQIQLSWVEAPGFVVTVATDDLGPVDELLASLETWTPISGDEFRRAMSH